MEISTRAHPRRWRQVGARLWLAAALLSVMLLTPAALGLRSHAVSDAAMGATVSRGSLVFERSVEEAAALRVGDVITFPAPGSRPQDSKVVRRVVQIEGTQVWTRGDASRADDPWTLRTDSVSPSRMVFAVPLAGYPQVWVPWLSWGVVVLLLVGGALAARVAARRAAP